jgi:hypothetical protein
VLGEGEFIFNEEEAMSNLESGFLMSEGAALSSHMALNCGL